jgi:hypothetical protein
MTASTFGRARGVFLVALVAAFGASSLAASTAVAGAQAEEVHEIRDVVPFGKGEEHFGKVTMPPLDIKTPPSTPLQVRLLASRAPALDEPVTLALQVHAYENAPGTSLRIRLPEGAEVLDGSPEEVVDLEAGQTHELRIIAALRKLGEQTIAGDASREVSEDETWGDDDALYLTVEKERGFVGHASGDNAELEAVQISDKLAGEPQELQPDDESEKPLGKPSVADCCIEPDPGDPIDVAVCWTLPDRGGNSTPFRDARIQIMDNDAGADDVLVSGYIGYYNGCGSATVWNRDRDEGGEIDVYVRLRMEHTLRYRIQNLAGTVFSCSTSTQNDVVADLNLGTQQCGGGVGSDGADDLYDDVYRLRRFVQEHRGNQGDPPGGCTVQWQTGSTNGTFYSLGDNLVHLRQQDAASRDTVTHECSHRYMHVAYSGWTSVSDCPTQHALNRVSGPSCAWSEGWTYVTVAGADGNPVYTWPSGAVLNLETPDCNSPTWAWDSGPQVEGRVGGVLIDLLDPFTLSFGAVTGFSNEFFVESCFGADNIDARFDDFWGLFTGQNDDVLVVQGSLTDSFSKAWQGFAYLGGGTVYRINWRNYYCPPDGSCVGALDTIPTFASD